VRPLRAILLALLLSLLFGFFVGLVLRARLEGPVRYIGQQSPGASLGQPDQPTCPIG
jgi:hypothetical protein